MERYNMVSRRNFARSWVLLWKAQNQNLTSRLRKELSGSRKTRAFNRKELRTQTNGDKRINMKWRQTVGALSASQRRDFRNIQADQNKEWRKQNESPLKAACTLLFVPSVGLPLLLFKAPADGLETWVDLADAASDNEPPPAECGGLLSPIVDYLPARINYQILWPCLRETRRGGGRLMFSGVSSCGDIQDDYCYVGSQCQ